ncbi:hypothetical protein VKI21_12520 [Cyanobacterium aponinum UTEX 3222]|uniref:hypothetical protein n=1 Tax=Cyanobacterium aponinum TaxID=379064 RepID=UPI003087FABF|nr:hypothetical protein VKI21_12520 [Cyanobacterium aponinum UTEX 3222]
MALSQHKIPIITGRNDVPTTSESQENHPNGSFTTAKYNDLIDELDIEILSLQNSSGSIPTEIHPDQFTIYVNASTGSDNNDGLTAGNPVLTLQKAIDLIATKQINKTAFIEISGAFVQGEPLDFSKIYGVFTNDGYRYRNSSTIILKNDGFANWSFTYNDDSKALFIPPHNATVEFNTCNFSCEVTMLLRNLPETVFRSCGFSSSPTSGNNGSGLIFLSGCQCEFESCDFYNLSNTYYGINSEFFSKILIDSCNFNDFGSAINATQGSHIVHKQGTFNNCSIWFEGNDCGFIQTRSEPAKSVLQLDSGTFLISYQKIYTNANNYSNPIANATSGTEITTINSILTALRNMGIIPTA